MRLSAWWALLVLAAATDTFPMDRNYYPNGTQIEVTDSGRHFNRPLYGRSNGLVVLAGDRPIVKSGYDGVFQGTLMVALRDSAGNSGGWAHLDPKAATVAAYRPGVSSWRISSTGPVQLNMTALPTDGGAGLAVRLSVAGARPGDELLWLYSGVSSGYEASAVDPTRVSGSQGPRTDQLLDDRGNIQLMQIGFVANQSVGNIARLGANGQFNLTHQSVTISGAISSRDPGSLRVVEFDSKTSAWQNASSLLPSAVATVVRSAQADSEAVGGAIDGFKEPETFLRFEPNPSARRQAESPEQTFMAAVARVDLTGARVQVETPDDFFNAGIPCVTAAVDGLWRDQPPVYVHGAMAWDIPLIGWRSEYGGTICGQPERVAQEGVYWLARQLKQDPPGHNRSRCKADPATKLSSQDPDSRFNGVGSINSRHYDMQSQMFEQQIHMWRMTGNSTHEQLLRPGLELHAAWAGESFDADGNGLYHSYVNTWPTDAVYYNGGESVEETAYMLSTHQALRDMARRAGDNTTAERHDAVASKIRTNFFADGVGLWINKTGHPAAWREEIGHRRLRPDPWSYSIFLPIDAKLLTGLEAAQALHFTEWGLQRLHMKCDNDTPCGQRHWTSNWVTAQY